MPNPLQPFQEFVNSLKNTSHEQIGTVPQVQVANGDNFEEMKQHLIGLYEGIEVSHSFVDENEQVFDCVPIEQQPALRRVALHKPPQPPVHPSGQALVGGEVSINPQLSPARKDTFGNTMSCPPGTIPMRRITLEELARFKSLSHFFRKSPLEGRHPRLTPRSAASNSHKYAHAYQAVKNRGGHNFLNIWQPSIGANQIFSLSQHWYAGYISSGVVQTVEVGWQVYPQKYKTNKPCLFIYWTADGYKNTGCYNLDCHAFVQTNPRWVLGGALSPVSTAGGTQYEIGVAFWFDNGNWWLYLGNPSLEAVGYYPGSLFGSGPLASHATQIDYGGETVGSSTWPPMGSGAFANKGWQHAAYQRDIYYYTMNGGSDFANLTPSQPSPSCYTISLHSTSAPWNKYFYFGGPGGTSC